MKLIPNAIVNNVVISPETLALEKNLPMNNVKFVVPIE